MPITQETADQTLETPALASPTPAAPVKAEPAPVLKTAEPAAVEIAKPVRKVSPAKPVKSAAPKAAIKAAKPKAATPKATPPKTAAAKPVQTAASVSKGTLNMNDMVTKFAEQAKARAEALSAEFGERAKDAMSKSSKLAEDAVTFNKSNVEAVVASTKIAAKNMETLRDEGLTYARKSFEDGSAAMKSLTSVKSPADFFKLYAENSRKAFDAAVAQASKNSELLLKMSNESFAPISNRMSVISSQMKVV